MSDVDTYLALRAGAATKPNAALAGFGLSAPKTAGSVAFDGNFAAKFSSPGYVIQADRGLTYGSTPKAGAGNTAATVMTLGGVSPTVPVPVLVKATNTATVGSGALFSIYYDGGTTPAMTNVALSTTPTALTGAGAGLTLAATVASSVLNNTWATTGAACADQSGNGIAWSQAVASKQPVVTVGVNGHVGLLFDGVDDFLSASYNSFNNGTLLWLIVRQVSWVAYGTIIGSGAISNALDVFQNGNSATPDIAAYNAAFLNGGAGAPVGAAAQLARVRVVFNGASSSIKVGASAVVNGNVGSGVPNTNRRSLGCDRADSTPINFSNVEVFALGEMANQDVSEADSLAVPYWGSAI